MGPKKTTSGTKLSNPSSSKAAPAKAKTASSKTVPAKTVPAKTAPAKKGTTKAVPGKAAKGTSSKAPAKGTAKTKSNTKVKKESSKEDAAATKIQKVVRSWLAKLQLEKLKKQKQEYDEMIEKLQKQAWLDIIEQQRKEDEAQRQKEDELRRRKRQEIKWKKDLLEAAFDGELASIEKIINEAVAQTRKTSTLTGDILDRVLAKVKMGLVEAEDANENSALSEACAGGDVETIKFFLDNGASINKRAQFSRSPIFRAAFGGHLDAVKLLLEHGADPRVPDNEGVLPEQVAALAEITECIQSWDISQTDSLLEKLEEEREVRKAAEQKLKQKEQEKNEQDIKEMENEYATLQKILQKAYQELNKRITEHDTCVAQGFERPEVTLQAIHDAEEHLLNAQKDEKNCREKLAAFRLKIREQKVEEDEEDSQVVKCHIKEMDDVLMRDVGNKIKNSGRWPLLVDSSGQAMTFLKYRDTNYLNTLNPKDMEADTLRLALLGAIRFGKPLVLDMMELNLMELIQNRLDDIQKNLYEDLISKEILKDRKYHSLIRSTDGKEYAKENFVDMRVEKFTFLIVSKLYEVPQDWKDSFYVIKIVIPAMK